MPDSKHRVQAEQPAEEHDLGCDEQPHAERRRMLLMLRAAEVVGEPLCGRAELILDAVHAEFAVYGGRQSFTIAGS